LCDYQVLIRVEHEVYKHRKQMLMEPARFVAGKLPVEVNMANIDGAAQDGNGLLRRPGWVVPADGKEQGVAAGTIVLAEDTGRVLVRQCVVAGGERLEWSTWSGDVPPGQSPLQVAIDTIAACCAYDGDLALSRLTPYGDDHGFVQHNFVAVVPREFEPRIGSGCLGYQWCDVDRLPQPLSPVLAHLRDTSGADLRAMADLYRGIGRLSDAFDTDWLED
jgi:hypothetical protein